MQEKLEKLYRIFDIILPIPTLSKDLFIKIRTRIVVRLLLFWLKFLWISLYVHFFWILLNYTHMFLIEENLCNPNLFQRFSGWQSSNKTRAGLGRNLIALFICPFNFPVISWLWLDHLQVSNFIKTFCFACTLSLLALSLQYSKTNEWS